MTLAPVDDETTDIAADLVARLDAEAELIDEGSFTLDHKLGREKLASNRLVDPQTFVLLLVEVAHLLDCESVEFDERRGRTIARLVGARLDDAELRGPFDAAFARRDRLEPGARRRLDARRMLGVGLETLLGMGCELVELASVDEGSDARVLKLRADGSLTLESAKPGSHGAGPAIVLVIHDPRPMFETRARLIRDRCAHATCPVLVGGQRVDIGRELPELVHVVDELPPFVFVAGWSPARPRATILFVANGVLIETHELSGGPAGALALVDADDLERDLSMFKLRLDDRMAARVALVRSLFSRVPVEPSPTLAPLCVGQHAVPDFLAGLLIMATGIFMLLAPLAIMSATWQVVLACLGLLTIAKSALVMRRAVGFARERNLLMRGVRASAKLLAIEPARFPHSRQDHQYLRVSLERPGHAATEVRIEVWIPGGFRPALEVGARYLARFDPDDPTRAVLEPEDRGMLALPSEPSEPEPEPEPPA